MKETKLLYKRFLGCAFAIVSLVGCNVGSKNHEQLTADVQQYNKAEFRVTLDETFENPFDAREVALDMLIKSPSGDSLVLPCFYTEQNDSQSTWMARFTPIESGNYTYSFRLKKSGKTVSMFKSDSFASSSSNENGFLHINDHWTFIFDSGEKFRGIGENVGWESRSYEDPKYDYDYLLPTLSQNGANFFRSWMAPNNFPLEWKKVTQTKRYTDTDQYFNPGGVKRLDEVVELADSLGLFMMLAFDSHNTLMEDRQWPLHNYNIVNGGPASNPTEFFTLEESRAKYKNRLRYIVARWGYATSIGAWEFFNEIDNAAFSRGDSIRIPHEAITSWHQEMAAYLKSVDPYGHIVTTSVSHREIEGMYALDELDLNQMHVYKRTKQIPEEILMYNQMYKKPFSWGEFGYEWDWTLDFSKFEEESDYDYKRGLWYGLFNPTPILPMTWWWEFFDERNMTPYFNSVRQISDMMLEAGEGSFMQIPVESEGLEAFSVKCRDVYFVCVLNNDQVPNKSEFVMNLEPGVFEIQLYDPDTRSLQSVGSLPAGAGKSVLPELSLNGMDEMIYIVKPATH